MEAVDLPVLSPMMVFRVIHYDYGCLTLMGLFSLTWRRRRVWYRGGLERAWSVGKRPGSQEEAKRRYGS